MAYIREYWEDKQTRAKNAANHTARMNSLYETEIQNSYENTKIYDTSFVCKKPQIDRETYVIVADLDTVKAGMLYSKYGKTALLNFASYKNPGGMFINGSKAQEECLCHESFLYNVLIQFDGDYYDWNRKNKALYLNRGLYSPNIVFNHDDTNFKCDVITCAAPNKSAAQKYCNVSDAENSAALESRIKFVLDIAVDNDVQVLILGAYGCGVFGQDPAEVAQLFKKHLLGKYKGCFDKVVFAIPNGNNNNLLTFAKTFDLRGILP